MNIFEENYKVRYSECDRDGRMKLKTFMDYAQETAGSHAAALGVGFSVLRPRHMAWLLSRIRLGIRRYPKVGETIRVRTYPQGFDRLFARREFRFCADNDISMDNKFDTICGITDEELEYYFYDSLQELAETNDYSYDEIREVLKRQFDGYHFGKRLKGVYNPFSILNTFFKMDIRDYWFKTGTPTYLVRLLQDNHENLNDLTGKYYDESEFVDYRADKEMPLPMIYQSGYLTSRYDIFDYDIPFYQMVLHGVIPYSCEPINASADIRDTLIKAAAYGSALNYDLVYSDVHELKNTEADIYFYSNYSGINQDYSLVSDIIKNIKNSTVVGYTPLENGFEISYSNNIKIIYDGQNCDILPHL